MVIKLGPHKTKFIKAPSSKWSFEIFHFHQVSVPPSTQQARVDTGFHPFYGNRFGFFYDKCTFNKTLFKLKSKKWIGQVHHPRRNGTGQYPVWMTQKPERGLKGVKIQKNSRRSISPGPSALGNPRSVPAHHIVCAFGEELSDNGIESKL